MNEAKSAKATFKLNADLQVTMIDGLKSWGRRTQVSVERYWVARFTTQNSLTLGSHSPRPSCYRRVC